MAYVNNLAQLTSAQKAKQLATYQSRLNTDLAALANSPDQLSAYKASDYYANLTGTIKELGGGGTTVPAPSIPAAPNPNDPFYQMAAGVDPAQKILDTQVVSQGDAAALNQVQGSAPPFVDPTSMGGTAKATATPTADPMKQLMDAYNGALRAGTQQTQNLVNNMVAEQQRANSINQQNQAMLNGLIAQSTAASQQSADALKAALTGISSGKNAGAQTQYTATDVSAQMEQQANDRKRLRAASGGTESTKSKILAQKALLSKPTLLGS